MKTSSRVRTDNIALSYKYIFDKKQMGKEDLNPRTYAFFYQIFRPLALSSCRPQLTIAFLALKKRAKIKLIKLNEGR